MARTANQPRMNGEASVKTTASDDNATVRRANSAALCARVGLGDRAMLFGVRSNARSATRAAIRAVASPALATPTETCSSRDADLLRGLAALELPGSKNDCGGRPWFGEPVCSNLLNLSTIQRRDAITAAITHERDGSSTEKAACRFVTLHSDISNMHSRAG